ncbi:MAG TPA: hypothetical protein VFW16_13525 [Streptosporangiaceae bacterium]|nr:hypothetical protein [Streptosporangiaceae bacterium]
MLWTWPSGGPDASTRPGVPEARSRPGGPGRVAVAGGALMLTVAAGGTASCAVGHAASRPLRAVTRPPAARASVLSGAPAVVSARAASALFAKSTLVVLANAGHEAAIEVAAARARHLHVPLLLVPQRPGAGLAGGRTRTGGAAAIARAGGGTPGPGAITVLRNEIRALGVREVLDLGVATSLLAAQLPGVRVITSPGEAPPTQAPVPLRHVAVLLRSHDMSAGARAVLATARAAGTRPIAVSGFDPRADPGAIDALFATAPRQVLAVGAGFGPATRLAARVTTAATGVQLPGGGQVLFPMHRLLALYGYPGTPALGALGAQGLSASIARIRRIAAAYRPLSRADVVPAFEIIATVAQASPGHDGSYSFESGLATLRPWVRRATAAGLYVVLDLQPGRASLLAQARRYRSLLRLPNVGLALDPEWKLAPGELPLRQIGSVGIAEVNVVIRWLAGLTARNHLPQKLLVLHQFRLSMISDERRLDTSHDDLAIVIHMDGQGTPADKLQTWNAVTATAPAGVFFGWKNFYAKDHPTLSPVQTMVNTPQPVMISYQ